MQRSAFFVLLALALGSILSIVATGTIMAQTVRQLPNPSRDGYAIYEVVAGEVKGCFYVFGVQQAGVSAIGPLPIPAGESCPELTRR